MIKLHGHIPYTTLKRCFLPEDLEKLDRRFSVTMPVEGQEGEAVPRLLEACIDDVEIMVTGWGTPPLTSEQLDRADRLRLIVHSAGSIKRLIPADFWDRNLRIATVNEALAIGVAETTLGMIIAGLKNFFKARDWTRKGGWSSMTFGDGRPASRETYRMVVGIVSASKVGRHLIRLLKNLDVTILVYDPFLSAEEALRLGVERVSLMELADRSDVVTVHAPALPETEGMIHADFLASMRDNAIFINTSRGSIVDEQALIRELQNGRINAFIDVTHPEPPANDHPFRHLPNVVLTPHIAGAVTNGCWRQGAETVKNILNFVEGKPMPGEISRQQYAVMG